MRVVVVISGPVRAGKTTLADALHRRLGAHVVRTKQILINEYGAAPQVRERRRRLQELGERLDKETGGSWVASAVSREARKVRTDRVIVVDAVRVRSQIDRLKELKVFHVVHVDVTADLQTLERRYEVSAAGSEEELPTYADVRENETEAKISQLGRQTRLRFNTAWMPRWLVAPVVSAIVKAVRWWLAIRHLPYAFAVGAVLAAILMSPVAWFLATWDQFGILLGSLALVSGALFVIASMLIGAALARLSPIERDPPTD